MCWKKGVRWNFIARPLLKAAPTDDAKVVERWRRGGGEKGVASVVDV